MFKKYYLILRSEHSKAEMNEQAKGFVDLSCWLVLTTISFAFCVLQLSKTMVEVAAKHFIIIIDQ